jgi:GntR family transcriptional regulator, transcriptional repressor for pyruvate dehydrogenase complex
LATIERRSISGQIVEELRREILTGHLPAGARLPPEGELAHRFGTNRNTLREAVRTLEGLNLIQVRQGDGVTVRDFRAMGELSLLPHYLAEAANPAEQLAALQEVLRLRRLVLVEVVSRAATGSTPDEVLGLQQQLELIRRSLPHTRELIAADLEFYRRLVAASHSLIYIWIFNTFVRVYTAVIDALEQLWVLPVGYLEHLDALTAAIAAHDSTRARQIMDTHLSSSDVLALELARDK